MVCDGRDRPVRCERIDWPWIPEFGISSPLFDKITISLNEKYYPGKQFVIETENNSQDNIYIQSMSVNGIDSE